MSLAATLRDYFASSGLLPTVDHVRRGAALRIQFGDEDRSQCAIALYTPGQKKPDILNRVPWSQITSARNKLLRHLLNLVGISPSIGSAPDWPAFDEALRELDEKAQSLMFTLLTPDGGARLREAIADVSLVARGWERLVDYPPVLIEVDSPLDYVHLEGLPLAGAPDLQPVTDQRSFQAAMWRFLGMVAVIRRTNRVGSTLGDRLRGAGGLPMKFFYDASLPGAVQEASFFGRMKDQVLLEGPWPDAGQAEKSTPRGFTALLSSPDRTFDGEPKLRNDQVLHFSCHCVTEEEDTDRYKIRLRAETGETVEVTLGQLQATFQSQGRIRSERPLVFLNACGSAAADPRSLGSFADLFTRTHRGMIGTETRVPDDLAAAFSQAFYTALLNGKNVGASLQEARWALVDRFSSPLGILYTLHADPDLSIDPTA
jgi:hypothetical protein